MARLNDQCVHELTVVDLHRYGVWVWNDEQTRHCPVDETCPDPAEYAGPFFIRAKFRTAGREFEGYLIGFPAYYAFALFVANRKFIFNLNLPDLAKEDVTELCRVIDYHQFPLYPLTYTSDVRFKGAAPIAGQLSPAFR
jgi:hypothetical protein